MGSVAAARVYGAGEQLSLKIPGKKIKDLRADMACEDGAKRVLSLRLRAVRMLLPLAAEAWESDVEHVHQLRVATRRAASAMAAFEACLEEKGAKKVKKMLKALRSAAGAARDADVHRQLFEGLLGRTVGVEREAVQAAIAAIVIEREEAQAGLLEGISEHPDRKLAKRFTKLIEGVKPAGEDVATLGALARHSLSPLAAALESEAAARPWTTERLHEIRIASKKLRYACEVFECCLDEATAAEFKEEFVPLLDALGELNDSCMMVERVERARGGEGLGSAPDSGVGLLLRRLSRERDDRQRAASAALERMLASDFLERLTGRPTMARSA